MWQYSSCNEFMTPQSKRGCIGSLRDMWLKGSIYGCCSAKARTRIRHLPSPRRTVNSWVGFHSDGHYARPEGRQRNNIPRRANWTPKYINDKNGPKNLGHYGPEKFVTVQSTELMTVRSRRIQSRRIWPCSTEYMTMRSWTVQGSTVQDKRVLCSSTWQDSSYYSE